MHFIATLQGVGGLQPPSAETRRHRGGNKNSGCVVSGVGVGLQHTDTADTTNRTMPTTVQRLMVTTGEGTSRRLKGQAYFGDISFQLLILQFKTDPSALYTVCPEDTDNQHIFDGAVSITNHEGLAECSGLAIGDEDAVVDGVTYKALTALLLVFSSYETNDMPLRKAVSLQV